MNPNKTQSMIVSKSRTLQPQHPDLFIDNVPLATSDSFKILGITFDSKFTSESHLHSVSSVIAEKLGLLRKLYKISGDPCELNTRNIIFFTTAHFTLLYYYFH